jgi:peptidoglycan hydrolase CwlO-like protein
MISNQDQKIKNVSIDLRDARDRVFKLERRIEKLEKQVLNDENEFAKTNVWIAALEKKIKILEANPN